MDNAKKDSLKNIMSVVLEVPTEKIGDSSSADTIGSWDSLKHMNLIVALEEEFKIQFTDEEIIEMMDYLTIERTIDGKL